MDDADDKRAAPPPPRDLRATYRLLRTWYRERASELGTRAIKGSGRLTAIAKSLPVIEALPEESELSDLEIRIVIFQIQSGVLNWSLLDNADCVPIGTMVALALRDCGISKELAPADRQQFRESGSRLKVLFPNF